MFATRALRQAAAAGHAERTPMIKFIGKRTYPAASSIDHTPHAHPASPTHELPKDFSKNTSASFSAYRQKAQQHGPLGGNKSGSIGAISGHSLGPVVPEKGEFFDRSELPARFRRAPLDLSEIDAIETGGATMVC